MNIPSDQTRVALGFTGESLFVAIEPPLTESELRIIDARHVIAGDYTVEQIEDFEPACTMIKIGEGLGDGFELASIESKKGFSETTAHSIADLLATLREGKVSRRLELVKLMGHHSSPFYPDTDALRQPA